MRAVRRDARLEQVANYLTKFAGQLPPFSEIGSTLGCSKSAIAGAVKRLRAKDFEHCPPPKYVIKPIFGPFLPRRTPKHVVSRMVERLPNPVRKYVPNHERVKGGCQYIEFETTADDSCKCLAERLEGSSYCPKHDDLCYQRKAA